MTAKNNNDATVIGQVLPRRSQRARRGREGVTSVAKNHEKTKQEIANVAYELISSGGGEAVSMREIAKRLGVTAMMPYNYYPSRDHIFMELRLQAFNRLAESLQKSTRKASNPDAAFIACGEAYVEFAVLSPHDYYLMFDNWTFDDLELILADFGESAKRESRSWNVFHDVVRRLIEHDQLGIDVDTAAHVAWAGVHGVASLHVAHKLAFGKSVQTLKTAMIQALLVALKNAHT